MDKKQIGVSGLVRQTEPFPENPNVEPGTITSDRTVAVRVDMKLSEIARLAAIATENSVTRSNLMAHALRRFIRKYDEGKVRIVKDATTVTKQ